MIQPKPSLEATRDPFRAPQFPFPTTPSFKAPVVPFVEEPELNPGLNFHGPLQADLFPHKELEYDILGNLSTPKPDVTHHKADKYAKVTSQLLLLSKNQDLAEFVENKALILTLYCRRRWYWTPRIDATRYRVLISVYDAENRDAGCTGLIAGPWSPSVYSALINLRWDLDWKFRILEEGGRTESAGREWTFWAMKGGVDGFDDGSGPELSLWRHMKVEFGARDEEVIEEVGFDDRRSFVWPCDMVEGKAGGVKKEEGQAGGVKENKTQANDIKQEGVQAGGIK